MKKFLGKEVVINLKFLGIDDKVWGTVIAIDGRKKDRLPFLIAVDEYSRQFLEEELMDKSFSDIDNYYLENQIHCFCTSIIDDIEVFGDRICIWTDYKDLEFF